MSGSRQDPANSKLAIVSTHAGTLLDDEALLCGATEPVMLGAFKLFVNPRGRHWPHCSELPFHLSRRQDEPLRYRGIAAVPLSGQSMEAYVLIAQWAALPYLRTVDSQRLRDTD